MIRLDRVVSLFARLAVIVIAFYVVASAATVGLR